MSIMHARPASIASVLSELAAAFPDSDAIAEYLAQEQCYGYVAVAGHCPVARYLARQTHWSGIVVNETKAVDSLAVLTGTAALLPQAVSDFVRNFDDHVYDRLNARKAWCEHTEECWNGYHDTCRGTLPTALLFEPCMCICHFPAVAA